MRNYLSERGFAPSPKAIGGAAFAGLLWVSLFSVFVNEASAATLVGHWRLDETSGTLAADSSGNGHNGTIYNSPTFNQSSPHDPGISFNGTNEYVLIPDHNDLSPHATAGISLSGWARVLAVDTDGHGQDRAPIICKGTDNDWEWALYIDDSGGLNVNLWQSTGYNYSVASGGSWTLGEWVHVVGTYDPSGTTKLYVDGQEVASSTSTTGSPGVGAASVRIASRNGSTEQFLNAVVDDVRVYSGALTAEEVLDLYMAGVGADYAMLFVTNGSSPSSQEQLRITQFESWGYAVFTIEDTASQSEFDAALVGMDVAYVSEEVNSSDLSDKMREATAGVVYEELFQDNEMGFATGNGSESTATGIDITDNSHYITSVFGTGTLTVTSSSEPFTRLNTPTATGIQELATVSGSIGLAVADTGATLATTYNGSNLALGRRVRLPFGGGSFDFGELNTDGLTLLRRAIEWAAGAGDLSSGLVGHWAFDEGSGTTIADSSVSANDASFNTGTPAWIQGVRGYALEFNGANDAITDSSFDPPGRGSVAYWFRSDGPTSSRERAWGVGGDYEAWQDPDGLVRFDVGTDGLVGGFMSDRPTHTPGRWYHFAAQYDEATDEYEIYINGKLHKSGVSTTAIVDQSAAQLSFGTRTGSTQRFSGALDDFRIYNRWLSQAEIAELYGLVGHWRLDESSGTTAADSSGSGFDAAITGTTSWVTAIRAGGVDLASGAQATVPEIISTPTDFTVAGWADLDTGAGASEVFSLGDYVLLRLDNGGNLQAYFYNGSSWTSVAHPHTAAGAGWNHYAATFNDTTDAFELYVNGESVASQTSSGPVVYTGLGSETVIGVHGNGSTAYDFDGRIDDVRFYNRALTAAEVWEVFGLIGHWRLDESSGTTAADATGLGFDGVFAGATLGAAGPLAGTFAADFDGVDDHVVLPTYTAGFSDGISIATWARPTNNAYWGRFLEIGNGQQADNVLFARRLTTSDLGAAIYDGSLGDVEIYGTNAITNNVWRHYAVTVDSTGAAQFYVDSVLLSGGTLGIPSNATRLTNYIARSSWGVDDYYQGQLHDVRLYDRPLTQQELDDIFNGGPSSGIRIMSWVEVANP